MQLSDEKLWALRNIILQINSDPKKTKELEEKQKNLFVKLRRLAKPKINTKKIVKI